MYTPNRIPIDFPSEFFGGFNQQLALELLQLVDEAHKRYNDVYPTNKRDNRCLFNHKTPAPENWKWQTDTKPTIIINGHQYNILPNSNLILTQLIWYLLGNCFKREVPFGFIAERKDTSDIYVVFRGTMNLSEWISNFKLLQIDLGAFIPFNWGNLAKERMSTDAIGISRGQAHLGFYRTYTRPEQKWPIDKLFLENVTSLSKIVEDALKKKCSDRNVNPQIYVTGHSLGGALATLAAVHINRLIAKESIFAKPPILYSFASPRVGDVEFASNFSFKCYRTTNSEDLVPKIPLLISFGISKKIQSALDYQHIGVPITFTVQNKTIQDNHIMSTYLRAFEEGNGL